ncbi:hypothetical protein ACFZBP_34060 [Streptomyces sp. NPDC008086]|uniref:hypothetical protein n=1 Tax=Streptomyces sp. NPDC008086 TaxID=3364807 RepID=UPI0036E187C0
MASTIRKIRVGMRLTQEQRNLLLQELGRAKADYYDDLLKSDPSDTVKDAVAELLRDLEQRKASAQ